MPAIFGSRWRCFALTRRLGMQGLRLSDILNPVTPFRPIDTPTGQAYPTTKWL